MTAIHAGWRHVQDRYLTLRSLLLAVGSALALVSCTGGGGGSFNTNSNSTNNPSAPTPSTLPAPTVSLVASPTSVASGGASTLTWSSANATSCTASGGWSGSKATAGAQNLTNITTSTSYTLTCTGSGGTATKSATVTVTTPTLSLTANTPVVASGGSATLSWTATNVSSCTASGAWSGTKALSGSQSTGALTATSSFTLACTGSGGSVSRSVTVTVGSGSVGGVTMPSLDDERATYTRWGWTWNTNQESSVITDPYYARTNTTSYVVTSPDIHHDTEGDDLWTYLMMYRRSGNKIYLDRANGWLDYFENSYVTSPEFSTDEGYLLDHLYGWGLIAWYEYTGDTAALTAAENIGAQSEAYWNQTDTSGNPKFVPGQTRMAEYSIRQGARHLLLATRLAEATQKSRWITLRDKLINLWLQSPDWDAARGMYFFGAYETNEEFDPNNVTNCKYTGASTCPYQQGARVVPSFHITILTEAFDQAYRTTGNVELKNRMVAMAKFVDQYGLDPTYQYTGKIFGFDQYGALYHSYSYPPLNPNGVTFWDSVYTTSLVNTLVRGYRYTADTHYYDRAKYFFNRGTKTAYGEWTQQTPDNQVDHFVDTQFASSTDFFYLDHNKGELQYTYMMFQAP